MKNVFELTSNWIVVCFWNIYILPRQSLCLNIRKPIILPDTLIGLIGEEVKVIPQFFQLVTFYCVNLSFGCRVIRALQSCPGAETIFPSSVLLQCDRINKKTLLYRILCREIF